MATASRRNPTRRLLAVGLILLGAATGAAFGRIFETPTAVVRLVLAGALAAALGVVLERRPAIIAATASIAGLGLAIGPLVFPRTTIVGLPTAETLEAILRALGQVGRDAAKHSPPVPPLASLVLVCLAAVWAASFLAHALVARGGRPLLGLVPPAALLGFTGVVDAEGAYALYAGAFLLSALLVLYMANTRVFLSASTGHSDDRSIISPAARRMAVGVTAIALVVPWTLPDLSSVQILDVSGDSGSDGVAIRGLVDIRPSLNQREGVPLFRVRAKRPAYWRLLALDRFDGRVWTPTDSTGRLADREAPKGPLAGATPRSGTLLEQEIDIRRLSTRWLPAAFQPTAIDIPEARRLSYDDDRAVLWLQTGTSKGQKYRVTSQIVQPKSAELDEVGERAFAQMQSRLDPAEEGVDLLGLPDIPPRISRIAARLTESEPTPYRKLLALQTFFRGFTYDQQAKAGHSGDDMVHFLQTRRGYCEQFAGTMTVMVRALGYPARVAIGFTPGRVGEDGWRNVTSHETHSWVEVLFPGFGWLPFEPTPTRSNPAASPYTSPVNVQTGFERQFLGDFVPPAQPGEGRQLSNEAPGPLGETAREQERGPRLATLMIAAAALAVLLLLGLRPRLVRWARRRSQTSGAAVLEAYGTFERAAARLGMARRTGETIVEFRDRLARRVSFSDGHLERLTALTVRAAYSDEPVLSSDAETAVEAARSLRRDFRRIGGIRGLLGIARLRRLRTEARIRQGAP